ncbi:E1-E2 ATPase-domain-containing protein [Blyttiomyces helicus]|uniref:E1-E2 ATPase-domain-containing protein n=1 Tax=Blyttiomyces helicus TaxID=388810 RepID=A0A4P9W0X6_9FUNG|nr:E1-E2 ATPase-domain-containing protein [Blyttiomyces helicus]|eukprot:RKO84783.1 E1-E2 ATPase-domain-containing protein [Blyttiomyces helicus]
MPDPADQTTTGPDCLRLDCAPFSLGPEDLYPLLDPKDPALYASLGASAGLAAALRSDLDQGLSTLSSAAPAPPTDLGAAEKAAAHPPACRDPLDIDVRREVFGTNQLPEPVTKSFWSFAIDALKDKTLIVLCIAAAVEVAFGVYEYKFENPPEKRDSVGIVDGAAIVVAVLVIVIVASANDYRKQGQFRALNSYSKSLSHAEVIRDGLLTEIPISAIVAGDVVLITAGDVLPADGVLISGFNITTDESSLTGESLVIHKDAVHDPFLLSSTKVVNGVGRMLVDDGA